MTFKRETRYIVVKIKDALAALSPAQLDLLLAAGIVVEDYRANIGSPPLVCVVVESDWPEYEPTWKAIEERVRQENEDSGQFGVGA